MRDKVLCIDLRWIDASGVGTYIKGIMPGLVEGLGDISLVGLGNVEALQRHTWSRAHNLRLVECNTSRYSLAEQLRLPLMIPIHTDLFFSPYYTIPLLYRGRMAVTVHDMSHLVVDEITGNWKKRLYARTMFDAIRKRASLILTVSNFSKDEFLRLTGDGFSGPIVRTHLGVTQEWSNASQSPAVSANPYFVHVGNVKPYKNLGRLVEAFTRICHIIPHDLVIVGQSEGLITGESAEFFDRVRAAGTRIRLTGFVSHQQLLSLVGRAQALVMPSLYEGFGLPPVEAMAAGVPVAVAAAGSLPEVCGDAALYFDPLRTEDISSKLVKIVTDDVLREQLKERGLIRSRQFTWERCSQTTATALRTALKA